MSLASATVLNGLSDVWVPLLGGVRPAWFNSEVLSWLTREVRSGLNKQRRSAEDVAPTPEAILRELENVLLPLMQLCHRHVGATVGHPPRQFNKAWRASLIYILTGTRNRERYPASAKDPLLPDRILCQVSPQAEEAVRQASGGELRVLDLAQNVVPSETETDTGDDLDELAEILEIVGHVGIGHDADVANRLFDSPSQRSSISTPRLDHDASACGLCKIGRPVDRSVVDDQHLAAEICTVEPSPCFADAGGDALRLVETREDHRHEWFAQVRHWLHSIERVLSVFLSA